MFNFIINDRTSSAVESVIVNPVRGTASVLFANQYDYTYTNVSRRAIANLIAQPNMSLGFWVNANCVGAKRTQVDGHYAVTYKLMAA